MKQNQNETEREFANQLRNDTLRCGDIFNERNLTQIFIDGLNEGIRTLIHRYASQDANISFSSIKREAKCIGDSQRAGKNRMNSQDRDPYLLP